MDKLRENAYWIAVGATVVVLALLAWYLVLARIYGSAGSVRSLGRQLKSSLSSIEGYTRSKYVPTEEYEDHLGQALKRERDDHNEGVRFYNSIQERFNEYFDGRKDPMMVFEFASLYQEKIKKLVDRYRKEFNITPPVEDDDRRRDKEPTEVPEVDRIEQASIHAENLSRAMKEYWIIESIFEALHKLGIGGLKKIDFPAPAKDEDDGAAPYKRIDVTVTLEMPFSGIEDLITRLFEDDRVLFLFDGLEVTKTIEQLKPFLGLKKVVEFDSRDEADRAGYAEAVPEPNVSVTLTLKVLDWQGVSEITASDEDGEHGV